MMSQQSRIKSAAHMLLTEERFRWVGWAIAVAVVLLVPQLVSDLYMRLVLVQIIAFALLAMSWNLTLGIAGIFNFAHVALFGVGAYTSAILVVKFEFNPWITVPIAGLVSMAASLIAFIPVIRLRGIYVALATFIFGQLIVYFVLGQGELTGGSSGMVGIPDLSIGSKSLLADGRAGYIYLGLAILIVAAAGLILLHRSTLGRSLLAIKDNEGLASSRGVPVYRLHLVTFLVGSFIAGVTGSYYAFTNNVVSTEVFSFGYATLLLSMVFLGGSKSIVGPVLGAVAVTLLSDQLKSFGPLRFIIVGLLILVILRFLPRGIAGALDDGKTMLVRWFGHSKADGRDSVAAKPTPQRSEGATKDGSVR